MEKKKIYLSGKVRGMELDEVKGNFAKAAAEVIMRGWEPVNPIMIVEKMDKETSGNEKRLMLALLAELAECDGIWMIDGWRGSRGAACEFNFARSSGINVVHDEPPILDQTLDSLYSPYGPTEAKMIMTSAEIATAIDETIEAEAREVAVWLRNNGFSTCVADGTVNWIVYIKDDFF